jgi:hypothetical protein
MLLRIWLKWLKVEIFSVPVKEGKFLIPVKEKGKFLRISNNELRASQGLKYPWRNGEAIKSWWLEVHKPFYDFLSKILPKKLGLTQK